MERRPVDFVETRVDQMEDSQIARGRGRPRKTTRETTKEERDITELDRDMIYDRTLGHYLINVADCI
jgi:hypothetical protein